jgi:seryl-tRNA synthetase
MDQELIESLDEEASERDLTRSQYIRNILESRHEADELRQELDVLQSQYNELQRQLAATNRRQEDVGELVEYVERQRELEQEEREKRNAPAWRRAKYWLFGYDPGE